MTLQRQTPSTFTSPARLLISVVNAEEAVAAQAAGADIIDIKDPTRGPLGMPSTEVATQTVGALLAEFERPAPVSLALGELIEKPDISLLPRGVLFAKAALAGCDETWPTLFKNTFAARPDITPVVALYAPMDQAEADRLGAAHADPFHTLTQAQTAGARGVLFDTFTKDGRSLLDSLIWPMLPQIIQHARGLGLWIALAGSLRQHHLAEVLALNADIVGLRGGVCFAHDRSGRIDPEKVRQIKVAMGSH